MVWSIRMYSAVQNVLGQREEMRRDKGAFKMGRRLIGCKIHSAAGQRAQTHGQPMSLRTAA